MEGRKEVKEVIGLGCFSIELRGGGVEAGTSKD